MNAIRLVLVGLGARGRTWLRIAAANPRVDLVGLCDPDPCARSLAREEFPGLLVAASLEEVLGVGADAALLATPPMGRGPLMEACCKHGLAILAEKPLADTLSKAVAFVHMAETAKVTLMVGLNFRYLPVTQEKRRLLQDGAIGTPGFGRFVYERWRDGTQPYLNAYPLAMAQPMLWEQSVHHFDLMRYVYRREPFSFQAHTWNPPWTMYVGDTNVSALITFEGGLSVTYQGTWQAGHAPIHFSWRTDGSEGMLEQRAMFGDLAYARRTAPDVTSIPIADYEPWTTDGAALLERFVAVLKGEIAPECTGHDHLQSLYMVEACILASARKSQTLIEEVRKVAPA